MSRDKVLSQYREQQTYANDQAVNRQDKSRQRFICALKLWGTAIYEPLLELRQRLLPVHLPIYYKCFL